MFWVFAAFLVGLVALPLLLPLARSQGASSANPQNSDHDRAFYQSQLVEIDRQARLGLIGASEADAARAEAGRNLLQVSGGEPLSPSTSPTAFGRKAAALVVLLGVPAVGLGAYVMKGTPGMPSFALADRKVDVATTDGSIDVLAAVRQIEQHLQRNPDDGRGYEIVGPIYMRMGRHEEAVRAFQTSLRLNGPSADRHFKLGEALVFQGNGAVSTAARAQFEAVMAQDKMNIRAPLFLAMADEQAGHKTSAADRLKELLPRLPEGELKQEVAKQITALTSMPAGGEAVAALPADQQREMIQSMVEGLAERLGSSGGPAADWARLIRALGVLGQKDRANTILAEARQKFATIPADSALIEAAAETLK